MKLQAGIFWALFFGLLSTLSAQDIVHSRFSSYHTYIYRLNEKQSTTIYRKGMDKVDETYFQQLVDAFPTDSAYTSKLPYGSYLKVKAVKDQLVFELYSIANVVPQIMNNDADLNVWVHDAFGNPIRPSVVEVDGHPLRFDKATEMYRAKKSNARGLVRIVHDDIISYFYIDRDMNNPRIPRVFNKIVYSFPLRYVTNPVRLVVRSPVDLFMSVLRRHPRGIFYAVYKPFRDIYGSIRWMYPQGFVEKVACVFDRSLCYGNDYQGYMVFDKPYYRPGETVRMKAFLLNPKGKPVNKKLDVWLGKNYGGRHRKLGSIEPYQKGAYTFDFILADTLSLQLDTRPSINLYKRWNPVYSMSFRYEDYELKGIEFDLKAAKDAHFAGESNQLIMKGTDINGLNLLDAVVQVNVKPSHVFLPVETPLFVPHTLWQHRASLETAGETTLELPDSIFPLANLDYKVEVDLFTSDYEQVSRTLEMAYYQRKTELDISLEGDSVLFAYTENNKPVSKPAVVTVTGVAGAVLRRDTLSLPGKVRLNPLAISYRVETDSLVKHVPLAELPDDVQLFSSRTGDSLYVSLANPHAVPITYFIYRKSREIDRGRCVSLDKRMATSTRQNYFVSIQYLWGGEVYSRNYEIPFRDAQLALRSFHPEVVFPGTEHELSVMVHDARGKPVGGVDVTAHALTSKFKNYNVPTLPYLGKTYKGRTKINSFRLNDFSDRKDTGSDKLDWTFWNSRMMLDSILYFQFLYPGRGMFADRVATPDSSTQVAPFIVQNGKVQPAYMVYVDEHPVYFEMATQEQRYSFRVDSGYHHLRVRIANREVVLDSVYISHGVKNVFSWDADSLDQQAVFVRPYFLTSSEIRQARRYLMKIRNTHPGASWVREGDRIFWLRSQDRWVLTGPLSTWNNPVFVVDGKFEQPFEKESDFTYEISEGLIKMKSDGPFIRDKVYLYHFGGAQDVYDFAVSESEIQSFLHTSRVQKQRSLRFEEYPKDSQKGNGEMAVFTNKLPTDNLPKNFLVFEQENRKLLRVYGSGAYRFFDLMPGRYLLYTLLSNNDYIETDGVDVQADGTVFLTLLPDMVRSSDSVSRYINTILERTAVEVNYSQYIRNVDKQSINNAYQSQVYTGTATGDEVTGVVMSSEGDPLPGVMVLVKGTTIGTSTDLDGQYRLRVPDGAVLVFSFIGFSSQEIEVGSRSFMNVMMTEDVQQLQEVVVTAYGYSTAKRSLTASVSSVASSPGIFPLQGKVAGVNVVPGGAADIKIRGYSTLSGTSNPLYVIDGVPYDGPPFDLKPEMIARIEVLKDESAIHIYGSRGANGVILITTATNAQGIKAFVPNAMELKGTEQGSSIRNHFSDVAIWQPRLTTDRQGIARFTVRFPDDVTSWKTYFLAMDGKKQSGQLETEIKSYKPLMGTLSLPRFLVVGDTTQVIGKALNYTPDTLKATTFFEMDSLVKSTEIALVSSHIDSLTLVATPVDSLHVTYYVRTAAGYEDGEKRALPVYPRGILETNGYFYQLSRPDTSFVIPLDSLRGSDITLYAQSNLINVLEHEIRFIHTYRYLCNEQLASKLIALLAEKEVRDLQGEKFQGDGEVARIIKKLEGSKNDEFLWGWWKGNETSPWISEHVVRALWQAKEAGYDSNLDLQGLINHFVNEWQYAPQGSRIRLLGLLDQLDARLNYGEMIAEIEKDTVESLDDRLRMVRLKQKRNVGTYSIDEILAQKKETLLGGMYWDNKDRYVYCNPVQTTLLAFDVLRHEGIYEKELGQIVVYLLEKRANGHWGNTYESATVLGTILPHILNGKKTIQAPRLMITGGLTVQIDTFPYTTNFTALTPLKVTKTGDSPVFMTVYGQRQNINPDPVAGDFVVTSLFDAGGLTLEKGKSVTLTVQVQVKKDADYVMIDVPVPAGCTYDQKDQTHYPEVHREYFREKVSIFCSRLPIGDYTFDVELLPRYSGTYQLNPAKAELMYFPTFYGRESMKNVKIK